jgi:hypothetical protein
MNTLRTIPIGVISLFLAITSVAGCASTSGPQPAPAFDTELPLVNVAFQPLAAQVERLIQAMAYIGAPLSDGDVSTLRAAMKSTNEVEALRTIQATLDRHCLIMVHINPESRVKLARGPAAPNLIEQGWRAFLVKVDNQAGVTAEPKAESPHAEPVYKRSSSQAEPQVEISAADVRDRWMNLEMHNARPMTQSLSGLGLEYRIIQIFSRDVGQREATISMNVGQGTQDIGFRNDLTVLFTTLPAVDVRLKVLDHDGQPTTASFVIRDEQNRVYPAPAKRMAPDFFFHSQIYRHDGESVLLPPGKYTVSYQRGPEYAELVKDIEVPPSKHHEEVFRLKRWIQPAKMGWYSGDHHVHAAGCSHYEAPDQGVLPKDMMRHILGEDLNIGCVLSWGPCWYYQKQFFEGKIHELSQPNYVMRYDVEVSGFPSSHAGHLCLLRLKEDDYPGTTRIEEWPSWTQPVLEWGQSQDAVVGYSHSGWGLKTESTEIPNYEVPPFDGIGANEFIVTVVHDAADFISAVDTPIHWELNIWYHTLNAGFRSVISGETDFPCIYGDKVGLGRIYVQLDGQLDFDNWVSGLKDGRSYVGDGRSHLIDFKANGQLVGTNDSKVTIDQPGKVKVTARTAAFLPEAPRAIQRGGKDFPIKSLPLDQKPYWDIERARIDGTGKVPVEVIVNGQVVATKDIEADGELRDIEFDVQVDRSSWIALRIFATVHTNPIFVHVGDQPIRASKKSVDWCIKSLEQCWKKKSPSIREGAERDAAKKAYDAAKAEYEKRLAQCEVD